MTPVQTTPEHVRRPLIVAGGLTGAAAAALVVLGVVVAAQRHGIFSVGVGVMLLLYGLLVGAVAWWARRGRLWTTGPMVAAALLHLLVVVAIAPDANAWWWALVLPLAMTAALALVARVRAQRVEVH
ncbi:hypothetical protein [Aestuariimicrobium kwangyangense]|uniref:hypothetical protein n=1 Tax=Aestuariimicrobium kwangyangense TaxID=396389 RepID=UPI0003B6A64F|nr:hypothetical protein [Aestuariimicrobium kwangyangense]